MQRGPEQMNFLSSKRLNAQVIFASLFLCSTLASLIISHRFFTWHLDDYINQRSRQGQMEIHLQSQLFERELNYITSDIYFLCHSLEMQAYAQDPSEQNYKMLNDEFTSFINERGIYDQVRLLDLNGMEVTRINHLNKRPFVIPPDELQDKSHRGYYQHCTQLHRGEIYISSVDLNQEYQQIEKPYKPVVRLAMAVYNDSGERRGYIILNYLVKDLLKLITQASANGVDLEFMLISEDGFYSSHRDPNKLWGWLLPERKTQNFAREYPELWAHMNQSPKGQYQNGRVAMAYDTINFRIREEMITPRALDKQRMPVDDVSHRSTIFKIVSMIPEAQITSKRSELFYKFGMIWS
ncbi:MAG: cache domain-containing protein, partial [Phycisphaeraceae bacterium JB051]